MGNLVRRDGKAERKDREVGFVQCSWPSSTWIYSGWMYLVAKGWIASKRYAGLCVAST